MYEYFIKRILDIIGAFVALILLSPVLFIVAVLIRYNLGTPVFFHQKRPGRDEKLYKLCKFRSMTDKKDENGNLLPDNIRLTEFGRKIRATSLDELPELWNILKGEMSFVGPRPQLVRDMVFMTREQRERHRVRPGLTGLAQTRGRNALVWEEKLSTDLEYIGHITFLGDLRILLNTFKQVIFKQKGLEGNEFIDEIAITDDYGDYLLKKGIISKEDYDKKQKEAKRILEDKECEY